MEAIAGTEIRTMNYGDHYQFSEEFQTMIMPPHDQSGGNSFTALLELPPNQALELLHCSSQTDHLKRHPISALVARAAEEEQSDSMPVKCEPLDCNSPDPTVEIETQKENPLKRKEIEENKGKGSSKKSKTAAYQKVADGEELPYVHVRARRGQATDSHSLAERARREKINARMKLLQEIVPGCNKISGTALVLEEIINHVHSLQRQVEYLSMRLAVVNPRHDFNLDSLISGNESAMDCSIPNMGMQLMWPEIQANGDKQLQQQSHFESLNQPVWVKEEIHQNLITSENSLLTYDSSTNSASLHSSRMKMEL